MSVSFGPIARTSTREYNVNSMEEYRTYQSKLPKESRNRLVSGTDNNPNYLRDERSHRDEHLSKKELANNNSFYNYYLAPDNVSSLSAAANTGNPNSSHYNDRMRAVNAANRSQHKVLTEEDIRKNQKDEYYVQICNKAGACAAIILTGAYITKKMGLWGGKSKKNKGIKKNKGMKRRKTEKK